MPEQSRIARRTFFAGIGVAAVAGIATQLTSNTVITDRAEPVAAQPEGNGYRLTEHIKKYYRTTTI